MIASFSKNFIFIRTRKTASTSTEIILGTQCSGADIVTPIGVDDEITRLKFGGKPANMCRNKKIEEDYQAALKTADPVVIGSHYKKVLGNLKFRHHMAAKDLKPLIPAEFWEKSFKFAVDRNPYDKVVSLAFWRGRRENLQDEANLQFTIDKLIEEKEYKNSELYMIDGKLAVDRLLKYENLHEELTQVANDIGLKLPETMPNSKGGYRPANKNRDILSKQQKARIQQICAIEFEILGYEY